ncbi:MAG: hypothetical protein WA705_14045 [Candidatus Ozemobacteraceae bacterium]
MKSRTSMKSLLLVAIFGLLCAIPSPGFGQASNSLKLTQNGREVAVIKPYPWSGWWWPRRSAPLVKVLNKFDEFVAARTGKNPGAGAWERKYHKGGEEWAGHCNGWSAASCLEAEPREPKTVDGFTFSIGDQKGLLTEQYMDCYFQFYGTRANHDAPYDSDILPHHFHRLLLEILKDKQIPLVVDTDAGEPVWNFPAYAFESAWTVNAAKTQAAVVTKLYLANDDVSADYLGTAGFIKTYKYTLNLNPAGEVIGGAWGRGTGGNHPDFVWVPTADSPPGGWENPNINPVMVRAIIHPGSPLPVPPAPPSPPHPPAASATFSPVAMIQPADSSLTAAADTSVYDQVLNEAGLEGAELFKP